MYKDNSQLRMEDFIFPYGKLDPENDWVKLAALVPWEIAEERYAARFVNNGHPAHPARMALGALLIQRRLKCSDQWLVKHIGENPYLQYFIGMKEYGPCPFGASTLVAFRKRFSEEDLAAILEASVPKAETGKQDDSDDGNDPPNSGTLILDATCCPADIAYPQDIDLLNQVREKAEKTVDELCKAAGQKKPRMYRKRARKDYLRLSKSKKRSGKAIRSAIRKQLQYIRRDIRYIAELVQKGAKLSSKQADRLNIMTTVYEQQRLMFESGTHSIPRRIVSLAQPWVRPIVRGKAHANTEFGSKLHISLVDGYARIERLDFEPFNESEDLWRAVARYRERYGCYPERILADKIYRSRQTLAFCKEHGIRLSGPALGKPPKAPGLSRQAKKLEYQDNCDRNAVEGVFGTVKTAYGLDCVMARLQETAVCVIGVALLLSNLSLSLRAALALFCLMLLLFVLPRLRSRAYLIVKFRVNPLLLPLGDLHRLVHHAAILRRGAAGPVVVKAVGDLGTAGRSLIDGVIVNRRLLRGFRLFRGVSLRRLSGNRLPGFLLGRDLTGGRGIVQNAVDHVLVLLGGQLGGTQGIFPQKLRHFLKAHIVAVMGLLPVAVAKHHHIGNGKAVSLEVGGVVGVELAVDAFQRVVSRSGAVYTRS